MKVVNLFAFVVVILLAALANWIVFQQFPWQYAPTEELKNLFYSMGEEASNKIWSLPTQREELFRMLEIFNFAQHVFVYLLAGGVALAVLRFGEKQIFLKQATTNWKVFFPMWLMPIACLGTPLAGTSEGWFSLLLLANWAMIGLMGFYSVMYQAYGAAKPKTVTK